MKNLFFFLHKFKPSGKSCQNSSYSNFDYHAMIMKLFLFSLMDNQASFVSLQADVLTIKRKKKQTSAAGCQEIIFSSFKTIR